jgi:spermidine synthase
MNIRELPSKSIIPFAVFITGACSLVIEVTATRILAPYFGNTIFSISSVISVVLAALALGYYIGGRLVDKYPREDFFYAIIVVSGISVVFLHLIGIMFLSLFGYSLSLMDGPIISSILLFFWQCFLLGTLSPFAIALQHHKFGSVGVGSVSGLIFFWSTLGSIAGSLLAGFFLIPHFGINAIMIGTGLTLIILGSVLWLRFPLTMKLLLIFAAGVFCIGSTKMMQFASASTLYMKDGVYQKISIYSGQSNGRPARFLMQDRNSSAASFVNSDDLVYDYTKYYAVYKIFNPDIKNALMIGGGAYSVPKALLKDEPSANIDIAEIEPSLFDLGKQYFNVPNDPHLNNIVEDGRRLLYDSPKKYDMMFSDAYGSFYSTPEHLTTKEFFQIAKKRLSEKGVFIANVIGDTSSSEPSMFLSEMRTFREVFPNSYFFAVRGLDYSAPQNIIFVGYDGPEQVNFSSSTIKRDKNPIIAELAAHQIDPEKLNLGRYTLLTDDFSPVEYLTAQELARLHY